MMQVKLVMINHISKIKMKYKCSVKIGQTQIQNEDKRFIR